MKNFSFSVLTAGDLQEEYPSEQSIKVNLAYKLRAMEQNPPQIGLHKRIQKDRVTPETLGVFVDQRLRKINPSITLYKLTDIKIFHCSRCKVDKTSQKVAVKDESGELLCNGCYGYLLSRSATG